MMVPYQGAELLSVPGFFVWSFIRWVLGNQSQILMLALGSWQALYQLTDSPQPHILGSVESIHSHHPLLKIARKPGGGDAHL